MKTYFSPEFIIPPDQLNIKRKNILRGLDVPQGHEDPYVDSLIDDLIGQTLKLAAPRTCYALYEAPEFMDMTNLQLKGMDFSLNRIVHSALKKSSHLAVFLCTAGENPEKMSKQLISEGHSLEGLITDLIGSEIAEDTAEYIHQKIGTDMRERGMQITNRYSPGYCNWPVSDQQYLFRLLGGHTCGIQLTESSLMLPIKSVSGFVGVGTEVSHRGYSCSKCDAEFCIYRDKR
jgi:hypothetical protein